MFNHILQASQKVQNQHNDSTTINILDGLNLIGKVLITTQQWNNQFSKIQSIHGPQQTLISSGQNKKYNEQKSFASKMTSQSKNFTLKQCKLCKKQQSAQNFRLMCKCDHKFCYSCLNAYSITKINSQQRVSCPQLNCTYEIKLSGDIYKYLPQTVKLKYLQWKNMNKAQQIDLSECCLRCLQTRHSGLCKVAFSRQTIETAYIYRKCYKCETQANIEPGTKKVNCSSCQAVFCYTCGQAWPIEGSHTCMNDEKVFDLENQVKQAFANVDKNEYCCEDSECMCFKQTGKCFNNCFYCKRCNFGICLGNTLLVPIRIIGSAIVLCFYTLMLIPFFILLFGWIISGIITGMTCYTCELLQKMDGGVQVIAIIGFPFLMVGGIVLALKGLLPGFLQAMKIILDFYQKSMCQMWIICGPRQCCS